MVLYYGNDLRKKIGLFVKLLFLSSIILFNLVKLLDIPPVKVGKTMIKESHSAGRSPTG